MADATQLNESGVIDSSLAHKWQPIVEHTSESIQEIRETKRKRDLAVVLENTQRELAVERSMGGNLFEAAPTNSMGTSSSTAGAGPIDTYDPIIVSLLRRAMPNLIAYDFCGVQPMTGPTGLVFAKRTLYANQAGSELFYNEADTSRTSFGGTNTSANAAGYTNATVMGGGHTGTQFGVSNNAGNSTFNYTGGFNRLTAEGLGSNTTAMWPEMSFEIEKVMVEAKTRAMLAQYSMEMAQDLKAIHGLDAENELTNDISTELIAELNREIVRTVYVTAVSGAQNDTTTAGRFDLDTDANGRWHNEKFKGLMFQLDRDANRVATETRRGKGNMLICSSDVASALESAGKLSNTPALNGNNLQIDDTGTTFVGILNGKYKVYIDPYAPAGFNYYVIGYKGPGWQDAGLFYCPYVPIQMVRGQDPNTLQPKIGFKTRYGMVANPYAEGLTKGLGVIKQDSNKFYRRVIVDHLM